MSMTKTAGSRRLSDWFHRWRRPLLRFLAAKGAVSAADLDDVAQEVFLRLMRYPRSELVEHPQAYLFRMAANVAAERALRARHSRPHESEWLNDLAADDRPQDNVARAAAQAEIERALNTLTLRQREVLKLQFFEGLGHPEIATRLGMSRRSVKRVIIKSYGKLREELNAELLEAIHGVD
jgi:RNA polymerase sigma factor (sigma-70 family)